MKTIECKKLGSVTSLTVGNRYPIISESEDRFTIINDKGIEAKYGKNLFNDPVDDQPQPAPRRGPGRPRNAAIPQGGRMQAARPEPAAPAPIPVINEINVVTGADNQNGNVSFSAAFTFMPNVVFRYETPRIISTSGIASSCGIHALNGLDELNSHITTLRDRFMDYVNSQRQRFTLSNNIDIPNLFEEIAVAFIQDLVATYQGENAQVKSGILILSTTAGSIDRQPCLRRALDNAAGQNIAVHNPNSGNNIVMWNIPVEA